MYYATDEEGILRILGGIHVAPDDFKGKTMGASIGIEAYNYARNYW